jgi:hypothetical protein
MPSGGDSISEGDDHLRNIKKAIKNTFPNVTKAVDLTDDEFSSLKVNAGKDVHEMVASCKYNGTSIKYQYNIREVKVLSNGQYQVFFNNPIPGADEHYGVAITAFTSDNAAVVANLIGFASDSINFSMTRIGSNGGEEPNAPVGFSMMIVDME